MEIRIRDFKAKVNREKLDLLSKRAPPKQWAKYATASTAIKILREPTKLYKILSKTLYMERRHPLLGKFYNNSRGKIGRHKFGNNMEYMAAIRENWNGLELNNDKIRILFKRTFFNYIT